MIDNSLFLQLSKEMKHILQSELEAGNRVQETYRGWVSEDHIFVFLEYPFRSQYQFPGIQYRDVDDPHYWKAEYDDARNHQTIACDFDRRFGGYN